MRILNLYTFKLTDTFLNEKEIKILALIVRLELHLQLPPAMLLSGALNFFSGQSKTGFAAGEEAVNDVVVAAHQRSNGFFWFILRRLWDLGRHMQSNFTH